MSEHSDISDLAGYEISSVCFVRDYVEFHFDGPIIRALCLPEVFLEGIKYTSTNGMWRDALCAMIGRKVIKVVLDDVCLELILSGGAVVSVSLNPSGQVGEVMHFVSAPNGPIQVW